MTAPPSLSAPAAARPTPVSPRHHAAALLPGLIAVGLMLAWVVHDGGYNTDTWYWGALLLLAALGAVVVAAGPGRIRLQRASALALALFSLYVGWSYLSILWAQSPGDALQGSNRALLYLLLFTFMTVLPWTAEGALLALLTFAVGVGIVAIVVLIGLASADGVQQLIVDGRLQATTGYFNSSAALFTIEALVAIGLATRRELPAPLRGLLIAFACAGLQLAILGESRGWLFTLPLVVVATLAIVRDRLRFAAAAVLPMIALLARLHLLVAVYSADPGGSLDRAAMSAGRASLILCAVMLVVGTLAAWGDMLVVAPSMSVVAKRWIGTVLAVLAIAVVAASGVAATHGHPVRFVKREWSGFTHEPTASQSGSRFATVGSGRYDFWRVALDAFAAHPIGGLGQDNFADYYITRRRTNEDPSWTHSLEMRLLAHTGLVGFVLFAGFIVCSIAAALRPRRRGSPLTGAVAGIALLPLVVWLIHGSIDWFWEMPALSGPALGFLGMAGALGAQALDGAPQTGARPPDDASARARARIMRSATIAGAVVAFVTAVIVLGLPYLAVREVSIASNLRSSNPQVALSDLATAAKLNPLTADPGRLAGTIALQSGQYAVAQQRFRQSIAREPGGWYAWLGDGLASSALGDRARARHDFTVAASIDSQDYAVQQALARVSSRTPMTPSQAFALLAVEQ